MVEQLPWQEPPVCEVEELPHIAAPGHGEESTEASSLVEARRREAPRGPHNPLPPEPLPAPYEGQREKRRPAAIPYVPVNAEEEAQQEEMLSARGWRPLHSSRSGRR